MTHLIYDLWILCCTSLLYTINYSKQGMLVHLKEKEILMCQTLTHAEINYFVFVQYPISGEHLT